MKKVFFIGLDSATLQLINPWIKSGHLPTFKKIRREGILRKLTSVHPPITAAAWPSAFSGVLPSQHGIYDFFRLSKDKSLELIDSRDIKQPMIWDMLSQTDKRVAVINIPLTYPARPINGVMLTSLMTPPGSKQFIYPSQLRRVFHKKFPDYHFAPSSRYTRDDSVGHHKYLEEIQKEIEDVKAVTDWIVNHEKWDFIITNFMAIDHVQHFYWQGLEDSSSPFHTAIRDVYQQIDAYLGQLIDTYQKDYQFIIASDHGATATQATIYLNLWLHQKGYLHFKSSPLTILKRISSRLGLTPENIIRLATKLRLTRTAGDINLEARNRLMNTLVLSFQDIDWSRTQAHSFGMYGGIRINRNVVSNWTKLSKKIITQLKADFGQELTFIKTSLQIYKTDSYPESIPDIHMLFKDGAIVSTVLYAFAGNRLKTLPITHKSAEHHMDGMIGFYPRLNIKTKKNLKLIDIAPTLLDFYNLPTPAYMDGTSFLNNSKKRRISSQINL